MSATRTTDRLYAGVEYTLSAYVNTSQCTSFCGEGVYLKVTGLGIPASEQKSESINYQTSAGVDQGWVRLSVTFTPESSGTCTIGVYNQGAGPYFYVDDVQLERAEGPSSLNMLENGSLRYWGHGWKMGSLASFLEERVCLQERMHTRCKSRRRVYGEQRVSRGTHSPDGKDVCSVGLGEGERRTG